MVEPPVEFEGMVVPVVEVGLVVWNGSGKKLVVADGVVVVPVAIAEVTPEFVDASELLFMIGITVTGGIVAACLAA